MTRKWNARKVLLAELRITKKGRIVKDVTLNRWNKASCLKCPATSFILVPEDEEETHYVCPACTSRPNNTEDGN